MRERGKYPQDCPRKVRSRRNRCGNTELACSPKYHGKNRLLGGWSANRKLPTEIGPKPFDNAPIKVVSFSLIALQANRCARNTWFSNAKFNFWIARHSG